MKKTIIRNINLLILIALCLAAKAVRADDTNALPAGINQLTNQPTNATALNFTNATSEFVYIGIFDTTTNQYGWVRTNLVAPLVPIGQPTVIKTNLIISGWLGSYRIPPGMHGLCIFRQTPANGILVTNSGPISVGLQ